MLLLLSLLLYVDWSSYQYQLGFIYNFTIILSSLLSFVPYRVCVYGHVVIESERRPTAKKDRKKTNRLV